MVQCTKLHVSYMGTLAPPLGQSWTCVYTCNFWSAWPIVKNEVPLDSLDEGEFNAHHGVNLRLYRFSAISGFIKTVWKHTPPTMFIKSSSKWPDMIFRPSLTTVGEINFDPHNRFSVRANHIQHNSLQTRSEVISQYFFEPVTSNLPCIVGTLFWGCPTKIMSCD